MNKELLYEGKAKRVYRKKGTTDQLVLAYKNHATAFNGRKKESIAGKARLNNRISANVFSYLHEQGIDTHFIERTSETEQIVYQTTIIPLEIVVRNIATGSITTRLGLEDATVFPTPIVELFYKNDALGDPLVNDQHAYFLSDITETELHDIKKKALAVNEALQHLFTSIHLRLVDFKLEFGRLTNGRMIVADEISPDTCRLWDSDSQERMDKDVFRKATGDVVAVYQQVLNRLEANGEQVRDDAN